MEHRRPSGGSTSDERRGRSARSCGVPGRRSSCSSTAARRTRTPGTPSRSHSTGRSSRSTFPATVIPRTATITPTGPRRTRSPSNKRSALLAPRRARGCRHVARVASRTRAHRPCTRPRAPTRTRRRDSRRQPREVVGDRAVHRRPRVLRELRRDSRTHGSFNPTRSESSLRRGILHNAIEADDGRWTVALRPSRAAVRATATTAR